MHNPALAEVNPISWPFLETAWDVNETAESPTGGPGGGTSLLARVAIIWASDCSIRWRSKVSLADYCVYLRVRLCVCGVCVWVGHPARPHAAPTHGAGAAHSRPATHLATGVRSDIDMSLVWLTRVTDTPRTVRLRNLSRLHFSACPALSF